MTKMEKCELFFDSLRMLLWDSYNLVESCNADKSKYLVPAGTENQISYYGKPVGSFRISDHWNWYANIKKCGIEDYIQCNSIDLPFPNDREGKGLPSKPIYAFQVAVMGWDGNYHHVYGDVYDRDTGKTTFVETDPLDIVDGVIKRYGINEEEVA